MLLRRQHRLCHGGLHVAKDSPVHLDRLLAQVSVQHGVESWTALTHEYWVWGYVVLADCQIGRGSFFEWNPEIFLSHRGALD